MSYLLYVIIISHKYINPQKYFMLEGMNSSTKISNNFTKISQVVSGEAERFK